MSMMNMERLKRLFVKNLLTAVSMTMKGLAFIASVSAVMMLWLAFDGEFAFLHVFVMAGIAGAFGVMAAVADAIRDSVNI